MLIITLLITITINLNINPVKSCQFYETKRICECSVTYTANNEPFKTLFDLPKNEECGVDLGCATINCKRKCLNNARQWLGNNENYINLQAKNKLCEFISPNNKPVNKINAWASWKYSGCSSGNEPLVQDMCCNKRCKCLINSQTVTKYLNESKQIIIQDLTDQLPFKEKSYECGLSLLEECQTDCMSLISSYFNEPVIKNPDKNRLNLNIFFSRFASNKVCTALNIQIKKPGIDIYAQIDTRENNNLINFISLGRVCCKEECDCKFFIRDSKYRNVTNVSDSYINSTLTNLGYECSDELSICMKQCRNKGIEIATIIDPTRNINATSLNLDIFEVQGSNFY